MINVKLDGKAKATVSKTAGMSGTSYTAGNGITITDENVIDADVKVIRLREKPNFVRTYLTNEQCESLKIGDKVTYKNRDTVNTEWSYIVSVKTDQWMYLRHIDQYAIWCDAYTKVDGIWQYDQEESVGNSMELARDEPVVNLVGTSGNIDDYNFGCIVEKGYCYINTDDVQKMAIVSGSSDYEGDPVPILSTAVYQGKYYTVTFEPVEPQDPEGEWTFDYTVNEVQAGGQQTINLADVEALTEDEFYAIKAKDVRVTYDDIDLLLSKWDESNDYPILTSAVCDNEYLQVTFSENEMAEADTEPTYSVVVEEISVGGSVNPIAFFSINDYSTDAELEPGQWDNRAMYEACQDYLCFIGFGGHNQKAFVSYADFHSNTYTFKLTGSTIEPGGMSGFGWDQQNQRFFWASDPK